MFTGIIQAVGRVKSIDRTGIGVRIATELDGLDIDELSIGDSICVNGVCLTVVEISGMVVGFDISNETLSCTTFASIETGGSVNIELAMKASDRLDGHIVSGHVDAVAKLLSIREDGNSKRYDFEIPNHFIKYICQKGSICIDGVSLTVNSIQGNIFSVNIIPHTLLHTVFSEYRSGSYVNIEVDIVSRYLERLLTERQ
jgi:riboflavin synthase